MGQQGLSCHHQRTEQESLRSHRALAQTGAVAILGKDENRGKTAYFASINSAKFKRKVVPGDILTLETEIIKVKGPIGVGKATAKVGDEIACIAELTFAVE